MKLTTTEINTEIKYHKKCMAELDKHKAAHQNKIEYLETLKQKKHDKRRSHK